MIKSITANGHYIQLYNANTHHIFDIDSISLLIGKNGSGKTEALKTIIKKSKHPASATFDDTCKFLFSQTANTHSNDYSWGTIYYTPVQHRPKFRSNQNFIDASNRKAKNIFQLYEHQELIREFDIKPKLKASLTVETKKIGLLLADALIENEEFRGPETYPITSELKEAYILIRELSNLSDFKDNKNEIETRKHLLSSIRNKTCDKILEDIDRKNPPLKILATFATITHLVNEKNTAARFLIEFLIRCLDTDMFNRSNIATNSNRISKAIEQTAEILRVIKSATHRLVKKNSRRYECEIDPTRDRELFEKNIAREIFKLDWPEMSSGQWSLFSQMINIYEAVSKLSTSKTNILVLIDEGDAFLHLEWQRNYIAQINKFLAKLKNEYKLRSLQLIIATHSPLLASDIPQEFVCQMERSSGKNRTPTFAAPLQLILNTSFMAKTIGAFATEKINQTIHNVKSGKPSASDNYIISSIDDPVIKREINRYTEEAEEK